MTSDPLAYLLGLEQFGVKFGLDNISALVEGLGHPERAFRSIHVAGTNGKGSVTAMVETALRAAGHRTARYTSPHLLDLTERFVVDGRPIDRAALTAAIDDVRSVIDGLLGSGRLRAQPTFFEATTAIAFELFRRAGVETAVCEVGMGGRLDATNVLQPIAAVITSIGLDHQAYLGDSLRAIALEKAGIIKPGVPVVVGKVDPEGERAIAEVARAQGAEVLAAWHGTEVVRVARQDRRPTPTTIRLRTSNHDYGEIQLALAGDHQIDNAVVAVRLLETIGAKGIAVPTSAVVDGLERVRWSGRLDLRRLPDGRAVLLDAAHNPDGAAALAAYLAAEFVQRPPLVFAAMHDKDAAGMLRALAPAVGALLFTRASNARSADPSELLVTAREVAPDLPATAEESLDDALAAAWRLSPTIVVAGSIFLLGDVMKAIGRS